MVAITNPSLSGISSPPIVPLPIDSTLEANKDSLGETKKPLSIDLTLIDEVVDESLYWKPAPKSLMAHTHGEFWSTPQARRPSIVNREAFALSQGNKIKETRDDFSLNLPRHFHQKRASVFDGECREGLFASLVKEQLDRQMQSDSTNSSSSSMVQPSKIKPPSDKKIDDDSEDESPSVSSTAGDKESRKDLFTLSLEAFEKGHWQSLEFDDMD